MLSIFFSVDLFCTFLFSGRRFWLLASLRHPFRRPILHFSLLRPTLLAFGFSRTSFPSACSAIFSSQADAFGSWLLPGTFSVGLFYTFLFSGRRFWSLAPHWHLFRRPILHFSFLRPTLLAFGFTRAPFPSACSALFFSQADAFGPWLLTGTFSVGLFSTFLFSGRRGHSFSSVTLHKRRTRCYLDNIMHE